MADRWIVTRIVNDKSVGTIVSNIFASTKQYHNYEDIKRITREHKSKTRVAGNQEVEYEIWLCRENNTREKVLTM